MSRDEDEYKQWQDRYEDLKEEWDEDWSKEEQRDHLENMRLSNEQYVSQAGSIQQSPPVRFSLSVIRHGIQAKPSRASNAEER